MSNDEEGYGKLPSLPDDPNGDHHLEISLGLPKEGGGDVRNLEQGSQEQVLPRLPDTAELNKPTYISKPSRFKAKKFPLKVGLLLLASVALILGYFSLNDDGNSDDEVTAQIPRTIEDTPIPSISTTTPIPSSTTITSTTVLAPVVEVETEINIEKLMKSVVLITSFSPNESPCPYGHGSGTIILDGAHILTNYHVIVDDSFSSNPNYCDLEVYITGSAKDPPLLFSTAQVVKNAVDKKYDLAVIKLTQGGLPERAIEIKENELQIGEEVHLIGYPAMGGYTVTYTSGEVSGWDNCEILFDDCDFKGEFYKTSAKGGPGVSGGAGFSSTGEFIGIPTAGSTEEFGDNLGLVRPTSYAVQLLENVN